FLLALTSTNHMMGVLVGPAVVVLLFPPLKDQRPADEAERRVEWSQWFVFCSVYALIVASGLENAGPLKLAAVLFLGALASAFVQARHWAFAVAVLLVAIVGVSVYLFLPIRAAHFPPMSEGEPTTQQALWDVLTRQQYGEPRVWERQATLWAQLGMWFQYFSWQWGRDFSGAIQNGLAVLFGALGLLGAGRHWLADRRRAIAMTALVATFTLLLIFYLNLKYGYSWQPDKQIPREVRERDYFFIASFALWGVWVGMGLATLMEWLSEGLELRVPDGARRWRLATPVLVLALIPLWGNHLTAPRKGETLARDFAFDLLQSVEPYGVLVTAGDNDTFPLWYAQEVEQVRQDVTVVNLSLANTDWYVRQLQRRPLATFDSTQAPAIYRGRSWPKPTGKLRQQPLAATDSSKLLPVFGFVNLPRTGALAFGVYHADAAGRHRPRGWVDRPSEGILATYGLLYQSLAQALRATKPEVANR